MVKANHSCNFHIFRYQLLPITQDFEPFQGLLLEPGISTLEELKAHKNIFFARAVFEVGEFFSYRTELTHKFLVENEDFMVIRLGANRGITRSTREFIEEELENWPSIIIAINNDPNVQKIAIQIDRKVFYRTTTVANVLQEAINRTLRSLEFTVHVLPTFEKNQFWEMVEKHENRIIQVNFGMISPNLPAISESLQFDLSELNRRTNTQETHLELNSAKESSLKLSKDDPFINSLVSYSSEGGGNIILKVKGIRKRIMTENSVTEVNIDNLDVSHLKPDELKEILERILT